MGYLSEIGFDDCVRMLSVGPVGRVALTTPDGPHIIPLNYSVVEDAIIVATTPYSALGTYGPGALVAFEVDQFDLDTHTGWSVVARGRAAVVADPGEVQWLRRAGASTPWADGSRNLYLRIPLTEVSGRRIGGAVRVPL